MIQYCTVNLYITSLPGNRYVNGIVFGCGEIFSMFFSNYLMNNLYDMTAFYIVYVCGLVSFLTLIFFAEYSALLTYAANLLLITSIGGWNNVYLLILEMRVPPQNLGSVAVLARTMSVGLSVVAPTVSNFRAPYPFLFLMGLATFAMLLTFLLPAPGQNLPSVKKTANEQAILVDKQSQTPTIAYMFDPTNMSYPMTNYALHQSSFQETYTERVLNVSRPQLVETGLDPEVYLNETNYLIEPKASSHAKDNSFVLLQNWAKSNES